MGYNPSYARRRIWNAKNLLKEGLMCRVGNESSIKFCKDKWLQSPNSFSFQLSVRILDREANVKELIHKDINWWKVHLIEEIFNEEEATNICGMAICPNK
jgi:hypothetical protein